ncbi:MAG: TssA family type VI secretion system protein, partial [Ignavibacteriaceae bacterium]
MSESTEVRSLEINEKDLPEKDGAKVNEKDAGNGTNGTEALKSDEIEIPAAVQDLLEDVPGDKPAGIDASNDEEYFKLTMEIPKTIPDYKKWIELSENILTEKSKDIKVAVWLCFAFYRAENIKGFKKGLILILHLLKKFGNDLYPSNQVHKSKSIQFISTGRVVKLIEKEEINKSNASDIKESGQILNEIIDECEKLFADNKPSFDSLLNVIKPHIASAEILLRPSEIKKPVSSASVGQPVKPASVNAPAQEVVLSSEKDAVAQLRKIITFFFEYEEEGTKKQRVPENYFVFGLSRQMQWANLIRPVDNGGVTLIEGPNKIIQGLIKDWYSNGNFDMLIARIESEFIKENSPFRYWFDAQKYLIDSLEKKGENYKAAAGDIKLHLAVLLKKIPDLPELKFKDKQTPFAEPDTINWLNNDVKTVLSADGSGGKSIMPPVMGEDYEQLNKEYEIISKDLPENFEKNLMKMQTAINSDDRKKGKFLRRLNLANYCFKLKEYNLAR